jgi:hypothetical protein
MSSSHQDWIGTHLSSTKASKRMNNGETLLDWNYPLMNLVNVVLKTIRKVLIPDFSDDVQWGEVPTPDSSFGKVPDDRSLHSRMSGWESHIYTESPNDRSHVDKSKNAESPFSCPQISPNMLPCPLLPVCTLMGSNYHLLQNLLQKNPLPFSIF